LFGGRKIGWPRGKSEALRKTLRKRQELTQFEPVENENNWIDIVR